MRPIDTSILTFQDRPYKTTKYAIISHRWGDDEVSHQDFIRDRAGLRVGLGWKKIMKECELAAAAGLNWLWIDTCCINKESSAELTEAISSMYAWYGGANICYVFLPDVVGIPQHERDLRESHICEPDLDVPFWPAQFMSSSWFTRGWTLQELLAPHNTFFFNSNFERIGRECFLIKFLVEASGIDWQYLEDRYNVPGATVSERMRWVARRTTSREEDIAYCLLGVFSENMPLLYGEGAHKAFMRLQLEIIKKSQDETIFAWAHHNREEFWNGLLASEPSLFVLPRDVNGNNMIAAIFYGGVVGQYRHPYSMTNKGLELTLDLPETNVLGERINTLNRTHILPPLNCALQRRSTSLGTRYVLDDNYVAQPTLVLTVDIGLEQEVLLGRRRWFLLYGNASKPGPFKDFNNVPCDEIDGLDDCVVAGAAGPSKRWKVYIAQDNV